MATVQRELRFTVTGPLGKLAKWLRILGFDTRFEPLKPDPKPTGDQGSPRILVSRKPHNAPHYCKQVVIRSDHAMMQIREVVHSLAISRDEIRLFTRCIRCNLKTDPVDRTAVRGKVPDYVWESNTEFKICEECRRIYWAGSHLPRSRSIIDSVYGDRPAG